MIELPLKTDGRGRSKHRSLSEARALVDAWKSSGEPPQRWCDGHAVPRSALSSCRRRVDGMEHGSRKMTSFVELLPKALPPARVRLSISASGAAVEVTLADLAYVIQVLAGKPS
jgi:hypothetical protein